MSHPPSGDLPTIDRYHVPVIAEHVDGWGVHCLACSTKADDYVYPCKVRQLDRWPPAVLVEP